MTGGIHGTNGVRRLAAGGFDSTGLARDNYAIILGDFGLVWHDPPTAEEAEMAVDIAMFGQTMGIGAWTLRGTVGGGSKHNPSADGWGLYEGSAAHVHVGTFQDSVLIGDFQLYEGPDMCFFPYQAIVSNFIHGNAMICPCISLIPEIPSCQ